MKFPKSFREAKNFLGPGTGKRNAILGNLKGHQIYVSYFPVSQITNVDFFSVGREYTPIVCYYLNGKIVLLPDSRYLEISKEIINECLRDYGKATKDSHYNCLNLHVFSTGEDIVINTPTIIYKLQAFL